MPKSHKAEVNAEPMKGKNSIFRYAREDITAGVVVLLISVPMCLGIALASGAPPFSGIVTGVVGALMGGLLSRSPLNIVGPAAGLITVGVYSMEKLGSFEAFLAATAVAGVVQVALGYLNAGSVGNLFPSSVIKGMIAAIGLILLFKELPHGLGYDEVPEGVASFFSEETGRNTLTELLHDFTAVNEPAVFIFLMGMLLMTALPWLAKNYAKRKDNALSPLKILAALAPLIVVVAGVLINEYLTAYHPGARLDGKHLISMPKIGPDAFHSPDFSSILSPSFGFVVFMLVSIASIESLMSMEAVEKMDPFRRPVHLNHELKVQGFCNTILGLIGGIPATCIIIRSSVNINAGAKTRLSGLTMGVLLAISVLYLTQYINLIPRASLASILVLVGYRLAKVSLFREMYRKDWAHFLPFIVTIVAIFFSNLMYGIAIGTVVGIVFTIVSNHHNSFATTHDKGNYIIQFAKDMSFLNKNPIKTALYSIPDGSYVIIDGTKSPFIDDDIIEIIDDFKKACPLRDITLEIKKSAHSANPYFKRIS